MGKNKNCSGRNIKIDKNNHNRDRTICKNCYNEKKRKNQNVNTLIQNHQPKNDNVNNNIRTFLVGSSFSGGTYLMLKTLSRLRDRDIYKITKSPPDQYSNSGIKIKERTDEMKPLNEYETAIIISDGILGTSISKFIDQLFLRGRHHNLNNFYLSQSYFHLSRRTLRYNSNKIILFIQTLKDIEKISGKVSGYDMRYDEFKELGRKLWEDEYNNLCIDRSKCEIKENSVFV